MKTNYFRNPCKALELLLSKLCVILSPHGTMRSNQKFSVPHQKGDRGILGYTRQCGQHLKCVIGNMGYRSWGFAGEID